MSRSICASRVSDSHTVMMRVSESEAWLAKMVQIFLEISLLLKSWRVFVHKMFSKTRLRIWNSSDVSNLSTEDLGVQIRPALSAHRALVPIYRHNNKAPILRIAISKREANPWKRQDMLVMVSSFLILRGNLIGLSSIPTNGYLWNCSTQRLPVGCCNKFVSLCNNRLFFSHHHCNAHPLAEKVGFQMLHKPRVLPRKIPAVCTLRWPPSPWKMSNISDRMLVVERVEPFHCWVTTRRCCLCVPGIGSDLHL